MRKIITLSSLVLLMFTTSAYAASLDDRERKHVKVPKHNNIKRVDNHKRIVRPKGVIRHKKAQKPYIDSRRRHVRPSTKRYPSRPYTSNVRRPHHVVNHHRPGYRLNTLHRNAFRLSFGGLNYRYLNGAFYRPYRSGFRVVIAPIGALIHSLPYGYISVYMNNRNYYMYENVYYEREYNRGYRVVEAPREYVTTSPSNASSTFYQYQIGDVALNLPVGAVEVIIDGRHYFEVDNVYFSSSRRNGKSIYTVVDMY